MYLAGVNGSVFVCQGRQEGRMGRVSIMTVNVGGQYVGNLLQSGVAAIYGSCLVNGIDRC